VHLVGQTPCIRGEFLRTCLGDGAGDMGLVAAEGRLVRLVLSRELSQRDAGDELTVDLLPRRVGANLTRGPARSQDRLPGCLQDTGPCTWCTSRAPNAWGGSGGLQPVQPRRRDLPSRQPRQPRRFVKGPAGFVVPRRGGVSAGFGGRRGKVKQVPTGRLLPCLSFVNAEPFSRVRGRAGRHR
jgi:hypothetical protein